MIEGLERALDALAGSDPQTLCDPEAIERLHRCVARLDAVTTRATAAFDASGGWQGGGARSAGAWVASRCGVPASSAHRRVALGRALRHLPVAEEAWLAGDIDTAHVAALDRVRTPATEEALGRDEAVLVGQASDLRFRHFLRVVTYWRWRADRQGAEADAEAVREGRRFHLSKSFGGVFLGDLVLDPIGGTIVSDAMRRIEDELFAADWKEARRRKGEEALPADVARTPAQRRADALVEMARRATTAPRDGRRPEPLFTVVVGYETFAGTVCELADHTVVTPRSLVPWLSGHGWSGSCSTVPAAWSTWARPGASSPGRRVGRWRYGTGSASTRPATSPPIAARSTTSSRGAPVAARSPPTAARPARSTIGPGIEAHRRPPETAAARRR